MSKIEELIEKLCPDGVEYKTLGEICDISRGIVISKDYIRDNQGEYPVYSSQTENEGVLGKISTYAYDGEYLTWTTDGANAGAVFYRNGRFNITNVCGLLKVKDNKLLTRFLYFVLQTATKPYVNKGMGNAKLMSNVMAKIEVPVPPMEVQREIVEILDNFAELSAELSAELTARRKQYEFYRDKLLTFDTSIEELSLSDIYEFKYGDGNTIPENKGQFPVYGSNGWVGTYYDKFNCEDAPVIGHIGAYAGIVNFAKGKCYVTYNGVICKHKNQNVNQKFAYYLLKNQNFLKHQKGPQPFISYELLKNTIVKVPPLEIQERIVNVLDNFDTICSDLGIGLPAEIEARQKQYEYYREKLLTFNPRPITILTDRQTDSQTAWAD